MAFIWANETQTKSHKVHGGTDNHVPGMWRHGDHKQDLTLHSLDESNSNNQWEWLQHQALGHCLLRTTKSATTRGAPNTDIHIEKHTLLKFSFSTRKWDSIWKGLFKKLSFVCTTSTFNPRSCLQSDVPYQCSKRILTHIFHYLSIYLSILLSTGYPVT